MLLAVVLLTACSSGTDPDTGAPVGPGESEDVGTPPVGGGANATSENELSRVTREATSCGEAVPASVVEAGSSQTVVGTVVASRTVDDQLGAVTLLEMGEEGGAVPFAIAISEDSLSRFPESPEALYVGREVCVQGAVQDFAGTLVIFAQGESDVTVAAGQ